MKEKKTPMRQCVGCREMFPKTTLIRAVKPKEGDVELDFVGKKSGRGAYICKNGECLKKARKSRALERAFACSISEEVYDVLEKSLSEEQDGK